MTAGWWIVVALVAFGAYLLAAAQWSGSIIQLPDGRFVVGLVLLLTAVGMVIGLLL